MKYDNDDPERRYYKTYEISGILYVPHYTKRDMYVAPGGKEVPGDQLRALGAVEDKRLLWTTGAREG